MTIIDQIIKKVEQYNNISLFFHELPDFDAIGACYALKWFIKTKYPQKSVKIVGTDVLDSKFGKDIFFFDKEHVTNKFLVSSIGIILDTSNSARIWTLRQNFCRELIRIDHHPKVESLADYEWIDDKYPSACQMVAELLFKWDANYVTSNIAGYLYAGIITDTGRFLCNSVLPETYETVSKLAQVGFDKQKIHDAIYLKSINEELFSAYILKRVHFDEQLGFAWAKIGKNSFDKYDAKLRISMVHVLNNVVGARIWMTFYYDNVVKKWKGSLRSRQLPINQIAEKYNGGGHKLAAGFTIEKRKEFKSMVKDIKDYIQTHLKKNYRGEENGK